MISCFTNIKQILKRYRAINRTISKIKNIFYLLITSLIILLVASTEVLCIENYKISPDGKNKIVWKCSEHNNCNIYVVDADGRKLWVHKEANLPEPYVEWFNADIAQIRINCGSPCYNTIFYDKDKGVSKPFEFVIAINPGKKMIATASTSGILLYHIFQRSSRPFMQIKRNFSETAALVLAIEEARFTNSGNLYVRYLTGEKRIVKEETIHINLK
jgi:hypothetical protein